MRYRKKEKEKHGDAEIKKEWRKERRKKRRKAKRDEQIERKEK